MTSSPMPDIDPSTRRLNEQITRIHQIMAALRHPQTGCPWDIKQDFASIAPYTIEEAYEVADAIAEGDRDELRDELGDLLLQVVFHAQMADEEGSFDLADVAEAISDKMVRRHPHVFGQADRHDAAAQKRFWEEMKAEERAQKAAKKKEAMSLLDGISRNLPAMVRAVKLQKRAADVGFDWPDIQAVTDKMNEELGELEEAMASGDKEHIAEEIGDILFVAANLARKAGVDPESALLACNRKFERRFKSVESSAEAAGERLSALSLDEMEAYWQDAKKAEKSDA